MALTWNHDLTLATEGMNMATMKATRRHLFGKTFDCGGMKVTYGLGKWHTMREHDRKLLAKVVKDHGHHWTCISMYVLQGSEFFTRNHITKAKRWTKRTKEAFRFLKELHRIYTVKCISKTFEEVGAVARIQGTVFLASRKWIKYNPTATLADRLEFLNEVADEFSSFDGSDLIDDSLDELCFGDDYLAEWGEYATGDGEGEQYDFDYRMANVEEDIGDVEELIELVGADFPVKKLKA